MEKVEEQSSPQKNSMRMPHLLINQLKGRNPKDIKELHLDFCDTCPFMGITDNFSSLEELSIIGVGLTSLAGFPRLKNLKILRIGQNDLTGELYHLWNCPNLVSLSLNHNRIDKFEAIEPLETFKELHHLELQGNPIETHILYKVTVFEILPQLKFLDDNQRKTLRLFDLRHEDFQYTFDINNKSFDNLKNKKVNLPATIKSNVSIINAKRNQEKQRNVIKNVTPAAKTAVKETIKETVQEVIKDTTKETENEVTKETAKETKQQQATKELAKETANKTKKVTIKSKINNTKKISKSSIKRSK